MTRSIVEQMIEIIKPQHEGCPTTRRQEAREALGSLG
jgi:hypothetical protein